MYPPLGSSSQVPPLEQGLGSQAPAPGVGEGCTGAVTGAGVVDVTGAGVVATGSGVGVMGEGVGSTGDGVGSTGDGVVSTGDGVVSTGDGVVSTGEGVLSTGEGVASTGEGVSSTGDGVMSTGDGVEGVGCGATVTTEMDVGEADSDTKGAGVVLGAEPCWHSSTGSVMSPTSCSTSSSLA